MVQNEYDKYKLADDAESVLSRLKRFVSLLEELGYDPSGINHGTIDEHAISAALGITPQTIRMFFGLYLCNEEERMLLTERNLDTSIISILMMIDPRIRLSIYKIIDDFLKDEAPVTRIFEFIDSAEYRMTISDVFNQTSPNYWAAVAGLLKDREFAKGPITTRLRSMLMNLKKYRKASQKQLQWLERAIIYDYENEYGIFVAPQLRDQFPEDVNNIEQYLGDYEHYECVEIPEGE